MDSDGSRKVTRKVVIQAKEFGNSVQRVYRLRGVLIGQNVELLRAIFVFDDPPIASIASPPRSSAAVPMARRLFPSDRDGVSIPDDVDDKRAWVVL